MQAINTAFDLDLTKMDDLPLVVLTRECQFIPAWHELVLRHTTWIKPAILKTLAPKGIQQADIDDAIQESVIAIKRAIERFDMHQACRPNGCGFRTFLNRVVHDWLIDFLRKLSRDKSRHPQSRITTSGRRDDCVERMPSKDSGCASAAERDSNAEVAAIRNERIHRLHAAILQLPPNLQQFVRRFLGGMNMHEISDQLHISYFGVRRLQKKSFEQLAVMMLKCVGGISSQY
jgi:RNA polymerase sigma factor (sigma-70 family)